MKRSTVITSGALFVLVLVYLTRVRPWQLRWGATTQEIKRTSPDYVWATGGVVLVLSIGDWLVAGFSEALKTKDGPFDLPGKPLSND